MITPYSPKLEVDRGSDSPIESFVFLLPIMKIIEHHYYKEVIALFMIFLADITMHRYTFSSDDARCTCNNQCMR